jgi:hypothetical protein
MSSPRTSTPTHQSSRSSELRSPRAEETKDPHIQRTSSKAHLVGHHRSHQGRIPSYGKNLNRLAKLTAAEQAHSRHHKRSKSHDPSRTGAEALLVRNTSNMSLNKDLGSSADNSDKEQPKVPTQMKQTVKFNLDMEDQEAGWTETSESQSPEDSRVSTKQHSPQQSITTANLLHGVRDGKSQETMHRPTEISIANMGTRVSGKRSNPSGLFPRQSLHNAPPQLSNVSVLRTSGPEPSPLLLTPGVEIVSKFVTGSSTSNESPPVGSGSSELTEPGQFRSSNVQPSSSSEKQLNGLSLNHAQPQIPSRTQQKLWLQRASSNIEPQQIPASALNGIPSLRSASSGLSSGLGIGGAGSGYGSGRDPRLQREIDRTAREYLITCRYRRSKQDPSDKNTTSEGYMRKTKSFVTPAVAPRSSTDSSSHFPSVEGRTFSNPRQRHQQKSSLDGGIDRIISSNSIDDTEQVERLLRRIWDRVEVNGGE